MEPRSETHYDSDMELDVYAHFIISHSGFLSPIGLLSCSMIRSEFESVAMDATIRSAIEDAILSPSTRENENAKLRNTRRRWCCSPNGMLKIWDSNVHFQDPQGETGLHRLYNEMNKAFRVDGRSLDLPLQYLSEMESHGFTNVAEHVYRIPLNTVQPMTQQSVVVSWADGFEAYSMDLLVKHLGKRHLEVFLICAAARQALRKGVEGWLEIRITSGRKPTAPL
ncbi:hypothetical protein AnigIFM60653_002621 [Aspergillus niger]|nr:hypothetical protein AnigIFM60653_002621 [Aspergillus niger]